MKTASHHSIPGLIIFSILFFTLSSCIGEEKDQIDDFKESILWADIVIELNMWKDGFAGEYDSIVDNAADSNPSTASVLLHLGDLNGRKKAIDYMLNILDLFLSLLEDKKDDSRLDETD